jgi:predicted  nucleic acid-binding Zn-ribbon protein
VVLKEIKTLQKNKKKNKKEITKLKRKLTKTKKDVQKMETAFENDDADDAAEFLRKFSKSK